jgi:hypothetical protein
MLAYGDRLRRTLPLDLKQLANYWIDRVEMLLRACVRDRECLPAAQSIDVLFHEYMADQKSTIKRVYEMAGLTFTTAAEAQIDGFLAANPRGKHGQVQYDLEGTSGSMWGLCGNASRSTMRASRYGRRPRQARRHLAHRAEASQNNIRPGEQP